MVGFGMRSRTSGGTPGHIVRRSLRFNDDDSAYLSWSPGSGGTETTATFSAWVKRCALGGSVLQAIWGLNNNGSVETAFGFTSSDELRVYDYNGTTYDLNIITSAVFRDPSAWYHIVLVFDTSQGTASDRIKIYVNGTRLTSFSTGSFPTSGFTPRLVNNNTQNNIGRYLSGSSTAYYGDFYLTEINYVHAQALDASSFGRTDPTTGAWIPRKYVGTYGTKGVYLPFDGPSNTNHALNATFTLSSSGADTGSPGRLNDNTWTGQSNGEGTNAQQTDIIYKADFGSGVTRVISAYSLVGPTLSGSGTGSPSAWTFQGSNHDSDWTTLDTQAAQSNLTEGQERVYTFTNSTAYRYYRLNCTARAAGDETRLNEIRLFNAHPGLGADRSGNANHWTPNNFSVLAGAGNDSLTDTPTPINDSTNGGGNYCTANPLAIRAAATTFSNGNLSVVGSSGVTASVCASTMSVSSGKWYWEATKVGATTQRIGIIKDPFVMTTTDIGDNSGEVGYRSSDGNKFVNAGGSAAYGNSYTDGDVIGVALDADNQTVTFYKNNTSQGDITSIGAGYWSPAFDTFNSGGFTLNFGQRAFAYTPPAGFKTLCTRNLPVPKILNPGRFFNVKTYTGTGSSLANSGVGFQPDFVWIKDRSNVASHDWIDSARGANKLLYSNNTDDEDTAYTDTLTSFDSDGFSLGADATVQNVNVSGHTYVAWCWKKGAVPGFDIVTYTGDGTSPRNVSHGLGVTPSLVIVKCRSEDAHRWITWHSTFSGTEYLNLDETAAKGDNSTQFNSSPTSSHFVLGSNGNTNGNGLTYVAYLWAEVPGFSRFGSYTGNGSADGPFVWCGFRPAYVLVKRTNTTGDWQIMDNKIDDNNIHSHYLYVNSSQAEVSNADADGHADFLSNGFKLRNTGATYNASGSTYIFAAFAEAIFGAGNAQARAR